MLLKAFSFLLRWSGLLCVPGGLLWALSPLGVYLSDLSPETASKFGGSVDAGALVEKVKPGSPADEAGLRRGDVVTAVGPQEIRTSGDLISALRDYQPGDTVGLKVHRNGQESQVRVTLAESPQ